MSATSATYIDALVSVMTGLFDTSAALQGDQLSIRVNGVVAPVTAVLAGPTTVGTFGIFPLNILAANNGASGFFTGRAYEIIARGASSTQAEIVATENWINQRTGAY